MAIQPDFLVAMDEKPRILQLTDMQTIDASQRRVPERLSEIEINFWAKDSMERNSYVYIRDAVRQADPGLILVTGDIVYGEFDDSGYSFNQFCEVMDGFGIPWAPVFGNHDNESAMGVDWQCERFASSKHCLFKRGNVTGNGNYSIGLTKGGSIFRVLYMMDSNGCYAAYDQTMHVKPGFEPDQVAWMQRTANALAEQNGGVPFPSFTAYHIPSDPFRTAYLEAGYARDCDKDTFTIGVTVPGRETDFGGKYERCIPFSYPNLHEIYRTCGIDGVFVGHDHSINTSVVYDGIRYTFGLKTGVYDYYTVGQIGGTLIDLAREMPGSAFTVRHLHTFVPCKPIRF